MTRTPTAARRTLRDDQWRLDARAYPTGFRQRVLWSDVDSLRHVNNGTTGRLFEEGRAETNRYVFGDPTDADVAIMLVQLVVEYLGEAHYPGVLDLRTGTGAVGRSSVVHVQAAFQDDRCVALAEAVMVKTRSGRAAELVAAERDAATGLGVLMPPVAR